MVICKKSVPLHRFNKAIDCLTKNFTTKMKKLVFMFVAMAAISFASCGGNNANGAANDSDSVADSMSLEAPATDSVNADSVVADSVVADSANA